MFRSSFLLQRSLISFQLSRNITNVNLERNESGIKHIDDLPTANKFLGLVDLELLRWSMNKFHEFCTKRRKELGDMYIFQPFFFSPKIVMISTPELLAELCAKEGKYPSRGTLAFPVTVQKARDIIGLKDGVTFSEGTEWKRNRDPLSKRLLRPKFLASYLPKLSVIAKNAVTDIIELKQAHEQDFAPIINRIRLWTVNSSDYFAFHRMDEAKMTKELAEFFQAMMTLVRSFGEFKGRSPIEIITNKKRDKLVDAFHTIIRYNQKQIQSATVSTRETDDDHITMLEYLQNETDFDEMEIIDTLISLLGAGVDTTTHTIQWFWYNLSKHPNVQDKLHNELHSVIRDSPVITAEHFNKLHYMKLCMKESMRITPSVSAHFRILTKDATIGGFNLPKNTPILTNLHSIHLDERFWDNPLEFKPERWVNRKDIDPFSFTPFGIGPRMCVGRRIAEAEMQLITAHLCMSYRILLEKEPDAKFETFILPDGLNLFFEERQ